MLVCWLEPAREAFRRVGNTRKVFSTRFFRKFFRFLSSFLLCWTSLNGDYFFPGMCGGALGLMMLGYIGANANAAICLYVFVVAIGCCTNVGFNINHLDLAPNYAGILMGFTNAVAALGGVLAPTVCGFIVHDQVGLTLPQRLVGLVGRPGVGQHVGCLSGRLTSTSVCFRRSILLRKTKKINIVVTRVEMNKGGRNKTFTLYEFE